MSVDTSAVEVSLTAERVGGTSKTVRVSWSTGQLQSPTTTAGVTLYPAIGGAEFTSQTSTLVFAPGQVRIHCLDIFCQLLFAERSVKYV